jgi:hypothetical protein
MDTMLWADTEGVNRRVAKIVAAKEGITCFENLVLEGLG